MSCGDSLHGLLANQITQTQIPNLLTKTFPRKRKHDAAFISEQHLRKRKHSTTENEDIDVLVGINRIFGHMNNHLLADYVAKRTRKFENDLSSVELDDRYIAATAICDTTSWNSSRSLENLPGFLEKFSTNPQKLWSASKKMGAPHTIIVAGAGLRASDLARILRKYQTKDVTVAKLFAKHIKVEDAVKFIRNTRIGMAVGTPIRLSELIDNGALSIDKLERIVVDASHIDQKKRGVLDMRDTQVPLVRWLNRKGLKERFGQRDNGIDLIFY